MGVGDGRQEMDASFGGEAREKEAEGYLYKYRLECQRASMIERGPGSHLDGVGQIRHDHGVHPGGCRVHLRVHGDSMRAGRHRERGRNRALRRGSRGRDLLRGDHRG